MWVWGVGGRCVWMCVGVWVWVCVLGGEVRWLASCGGLGDEAPTT